MCTFLFHSASRNCLYGDNVGPIVEVGSLQLFTVLPSVSFAPVEIVGLQFAAKPRLIF